MDVRLYATLRPIVGGSKVSLDCGPGSTFEQLLDELIERWPALKSELFDRNGQLHNNIHVFLNGRDVRYLGGLGMEIPENAEVRIFPPVGGGTDAAGTDNGDTSHGEQPLVHDYYGVPIWLMKDYLSSLGAVEHEGNLMVADEWQATMRKAKPREIGSLRVGGTTVEFTGEPAALDAMFTKLHWKTLRGGG
jgi:molybdopterin synthase sulfur carrier subunit